MKVTGAGSKGLVFQMNMDHLALQNFQIPEGSANELSLNGFSLATSLLGKDSLEDVKMLD